MILFDATMILVTETLWIRSQCCGFVPS